MMTTQPPLLEAIPVGVLAADAAGHITYANESARRFLGGLPTDGADLATLAHVGDRAQLRGLWGRCLFEQQGVRGDIRFGHEESPRWLAVELTPLSGPDGGGVVCVLYDESETRKEVDALLLAREEAERQCAMAFANAAVSRAVADEACAATQARSEFIASLTDELRTPLAGMIGLAEAALASGSQPALRDGLETVRSGASAVLAIVDDVLDLSRLDAGALSFSEIPFRLRDCVEGAVASALDGTAPCHTVRCEFDAAVPDAMIGDPGRIRQIVGNVVRGIAATARPGEILVRTLLGPSRLLRPGVLVRFEVSSPLRQLGRERSFTPLRERLTQALVDAMGGEPLRGSLEGGHGPVCFGLGIPGLAPENDLPLADRTLAGLRALLVSASPGPLAEALRRFGLQIEIATGIEAAHALVVEARLDGRIDFAIVDERPLASDGLDHAAALRRANARLPIAFLASAGRRGDGARCLEAGVGAYLPKPVSDVELRLALSSLVENAEAASDDEPFAPITRHSLREQGAELPASGGPPAVDREILLERLGGDEELMREMAALLLDQLGKLVDAIGEAAHALDPQRLFRAAHSLKGAASNLAAARTAEAARRLESIGRDARMDEVPAAMEVLREEVDRLRPELAALAA